MNNIYCLAQGVPAPTPESAPAPAPVTATEATSTTVQPTESSAPQATGSAYDQYSGLITLVLIVVLMYVLLIRPQRKAQKEQQERINSLTCGSKVITNAGIHGTVRKVNDDSTVEVEISNGVVIRLEKQAIVNVQK